MRFTLIDIGSNSIKCNLYDEAPSLHLLFSQSRTTGLIRYVENDALSEAGEQVLYSVLEEFRRFSREMGCEEVLCVATASLRGLTNRDAIVERINNSGCRMRIISGREEAMMGFYATRHILPEQGKGILIDLGGASTELTAFSDREIRQFVSLPMGCLALYKDHVSTVFPSSDERKEIRSHVKELIAPLDWLEEYGQRLYLIGGSAKLIGKLIALRDGCRYEDGMTLSFSDLESLYRDFREPKKKQIGQLIDAAPDRLHTFLPALFAIRRIAKSADTDSLTICFSGVREGLALTALSELRKEEA